MTRDALIADIGATNARFALLRDGEITEIEVLRTASRDTPAALAHAYLERRGLAMPPRVAFCIAGTLAADTADDEPIEMVNTGWRFTRAGTRAALGVDEFHMVNDFAALALGLNALDEADLLPLGGARRAPAAPKLVLGPGSGLGMAALLPVPDAAGRPERWIPLPGEGGHQTLQGQTGREAEVLAEMRRYCDHVCIERVVSGPGLVFLYDTLRSLSGETAASGRAPEEIIAAGLERPGEDAAADEALALFCGFLGGIAGDAALVYGARGGVYLTGGVAGALKSYIGQSPFNARFCAKGPMGEMIAPVARALITHPFPAFLGLKAML